MIRSTSPRKAGLWDCMGAGSIPDPYARLDATTCTGAQRQIRRVDVVLAFTANISVEYKDMQRRLASLSATSARIESKSLAQLGQLKYAIFYLSQFGREMFKTFQEHRKSSK